MLKDSLLKIREFEDFDPSKYRSINIAWPVEIFECSASMRLPKDLDCLAEAVLKFINIGISDTKEIARMLHISPDLVQHIKRNLLDTEFIDDNMERITEKGINFFQKTSKAQFSEKKDFGYMLMSLFDGDIMPYFIKGQMPFIGGFPAQTCKLRLNSANNVLKNQLDKTLRQKYIVKSLDEITVNNKENDIKPILGKQEDHTITEQRQATKVVVNTEEYVVLKKAWNESEQTFDIQAIKDELKKTAQEQAIALAEDTFEAIHKERVEKSTRLQQDIDVAQKLLAELEKKKDALNEAIVQQEAKASMRAEQIIATAESKAKKEAETIVRKAQIDAERANEELTASLKKKETENSNKEGVKTYE